ncbi:MAG TPA: DEAD/DEAH box helicase, partial [Terriglobales bacterium]|nr:DEAD/DEAH box helicase [Terriglobales bacterium]
MLELDSQVQYVKGVGPARAEALAAKGITSVEDLLCYMPFRYEDRSNPRRIADLRPGEMATLIAEVRNSALFRTRRMPIFEMTVGELGDRRPPEFGKSPPATIKCLWFNATYLKDRFKPGQVLALYGKVEQDKRRPDRLQLMQPQVEVLSEGEEGEEALAQSLEIGRIVPIYEGMGKGMLTSRGLRRVIRTALESVNPAIAETIPEAVRKRLGLIPRSQAFWRVHWPEPDEPLSNLQACRSAAHIRLIFEELFFLQLGLELKRRSLRERPGISFRLDDPVREALKRILPFKPTAAQKKVLGEIAADMRQPVPMRRLLQGDVGSGKTIVAFQAAIIAIENGYQVALMAPTEILAAQHYLSARSILEKAGYRIVLL